MLTGAAPPHVQTADYWGGYAGTHKVPAQTAARRLTWAETNPADSRTLGALGVKTILYSNPNRLQPGDTMFQDQDALYSHTCFGGRVNTSGPIHMTNPDSDSLLHDWKQYVESHMSGSSYAAVFEDEAVGTAYSGQEPCGYSLQKWISSETRLQQRLGRPVIYNALSDMSNHDIAPEIALNRTAIGGMMEQCYAQSAPDTRSTGWRWTATENTELQMARERKYFFCYGNDLTAADRAQESREYAYASFILTYDPATSVLWEYYGTPSGGHVMPESQLVPLDPVRSSIRSVDDLRSPSGVYTREYRRCFIDAHPAGPCIVAVNPDNSSHDVDLSRWRKVLVLRGSGAFDGGSIGVQGGPMPRSLGPMQAVIAFR